VGAAVTVQQVTECLVLKVEHSVYYYIMVRMFAHYPVVRCASCQTFSGLSVERSGCPFIKCSMVFLSNIRYFSTATNIFS
jgi:hypothetical protein